MQVSRDWHGVSWQSPSGASADCPVRARHCVFNSARHHSTYVSRALSSSALSPSLARTDPSECSAATTCSIFPASERARSGADYLGAELLRAHRLLPRDWPENVERDYRSDAED